MRNFLLIMSQEITIFLPFIFVFEKSKNFPFNLYFSPVMEEEKVHLLAYTFVFFLYT